MYLYLLYYSVRRLERYMIVGNRAHSRRITEMSFYREIIKKTNKKDFTIPKIDNSRQASYVVLQQNTIRYIFSISCKPRCTYLVSFAFALDVYTLKRLRLLDKSFSSNFSGNTKSKIAFRRACLRITRYTRVKSQPSRFFCAIFDFLRFRSPARFHFSFKRNFERAVIQRS